MYTYFEVIKGEWLENPYNHVPLVKIEGPVTGISSSSSLLYLGVCSNPSMKINEKVGFRDIYESLNLMDV